MKIRREASFDAAVGAEVRRLRERRKLTRASLAAQTGLAHTTIERVENGEVTSTIYTIKLIAEALKTPAWRILWAATRALDAQAVAE